MEVKFDDNGIRHESVKIPNIKNIFKKRYVAIKVKDDIHTDNYFANDNDYSKSCLQDEESY